MTQIRPSKLTTLSLLQWRLSQSAAEVAVLYHERAEWRSLTWETYAATINRLSYRLQEVGCTRGDRVAIYAETCFQWAALDLAIQAFGGVVVAIHPLYSVSEVLHALNVSRAKLLFYGGDTPERNIGEIISNSECELGAYSLEAPTGVTPGVRFYDDFLRGTGTPVPNSSAENFPGSQQVTEDDIATLVFTSGTSGLPKAVCLTQKNLVATALASYGHVNQRASNPRSFHWLPFAHLFGRIGLYLDMAAGCSAAYSRGIQHIADDLKRARPQFIFAVPKALTRFQSVILERVKEQVRWKRILVNGALRIAARTEGTRGPAGRNASQLLQELLRKTVFADIIRHFGGSLQLIIVGGAPIEPSLCRFFEPFGIAVREGYGMTETSGVAFVNPYDKCHVGTVGTPIGTVRFKMAEDGELLLKGSSLCQGYLDPADNVNAFTADGWFRTGDLVTTDEHGFLKVIGRKKDIIITDAGENISPERIEAKLTSFRLVKDAIVVGDKKPYLVAIISVDANTLPTHERLRNDLHESVLVGAVQRIVDEVNCSLAKYETIKRFVLTSDAFSVESGELTLTLKKRRKIIERRFESSIEMLYRPATS